MKIAVVGMGYVGLSNAVLLSQKHKISILEISKEKVELFNKKILPIKDNLINEYLRKKSLDIYATTNETEAFKGAKYIILCVPTNYVTQTKSFDTSIIESMIGNIARSSFKGLIVIRSTLPVGFTKKIQRRYKNLKLAFFPEFLREGSALHDCLYPSRIICGSRTKEAKNFAITLANCCHTKNVDIFYTDFEEAESIKLFANTYLAMRVSFFNELDSFALSKSLNARDIIMGISMDKRIGNFYNNPSFGYGGYCLPKDTKQLFSDFQSIPQTLIKGIVQSNKKRKNFIADEIIKNKAQRIGIYRLSMKADSDNFRDAAILDIIQLLKKAKKKIFIYEPMFKRKKYKDMEVCNNFDNFVAKVELILANRITDELEKIDTEVFSRDIFKSN